MATPFSPFARKPKPPVKRRQSQIPADLIDWDAPEIPELDKQKIIYEDHIKELVEDHEIEMLLQEQIVSIAHDTIINEYKAKINLLLGQLKMYEEGVMEKKNDLEKFKDQLDVIKDKLASYHA